MDYDKGNQRKGEAPPIEETFNNNKEDKECAKMLDKITRNRGRDSQTGTKEQQ